MECVICGGSAGLFNEQRIGRYRDEKVYVKTEFYRCQDCGEEFFSPIQLKSHTREVRNEVRRKYGLLPPEKIVAIRKKLGLTQSELEELLDTGPKVVVRWENGKVIQSSAHDNMLRLLDQDPSMLDKLRQLQNARLGERKKYEQSQKPKGMVAHA